MNDFEIVIAFGKNRFDKHWKNEYLTWGELVEQFQNVRRTSETMAEYDSMTLEQQGKIKNGAAFVGGFIQKGRRIKENIQIRSVLTLDVDFGTEDFLFDVELALGGYAYVLYSTHSHRKGQPKYRLIIPVDREMMPDEYAAISRKIAALIGMEYFDKTTFQAARLMYLPSCSKDAEPELIEEAGGLLEADSILAKYEDWTDPTQWDRHPDEEEQRQAAKKMEAPQSKQGLIGAFCRQYSISEAIEKFIPESYEQTAAEDRYTYVGASSYGGLVVYDDLYAYSHHESDPVSGREVNAFDLVRLHKFKELDEHVKEHTNITKRPSYQVMIDFAMKDEGVMMEIVADEFGDMMEGEDLDWMAKLERNKKNPNIILSNSRNLELILTNGPLKDTLAFDAFKNTEVIRQDLPWRKKDRPFMDYEPWLGSDDRRLPHYLNKMYEIKAEGMIRNALTEVVHVNTFHPIKEYLESQKWDRVKRLESLFIDYLGAEDTAYVREVTKKMFVAAVKRIYEPGCKFDEMLVLVGPQGVGKSSLLAKMGRSWFSDSIKKFDSKEAGEHLQGAWIIEIGELAAMKKAEIEEVKSFLSKVEDRYRVAYDRVVSDFPRKCIFFGTTNNRNFLSDPTGNRRFWPVDVGVQEAKKNHFQDLEEEGIGQLWAEALELYKQGETMKLSKEAHDEAIQQQEGHFEADTREGLIADYLEKPLPEEWDSMDTFQRQEYLENPIGDIERKIVCVAEIWTECLGLPLSALKPWESKPIAEIIRRIPRWQDRKPCKLRFKHYGMQKAFEKV